jgi:hypothetical protein
MELNHSLIRRGEFGDLVHYYRFGGHLARLQLQAELVDRIEDARSCSVGILRGLKGVAFKIIWRSVSELLMGWSAAYKPRGAGL